MKYTFRWNTIISIICFGFLLLILNILPVCAESLNIRPVPSRDIKGFLEVSLYTELASRTVVEETKPGINFEGDAESTRLMVRLATRPWHPVEFYIHAGMANLFIDQFNDYRGDYGFAYGGGISLTLYENQGPNRLKVLARGDVLNFETTDHVWTVINSQDEFVKENIMWREFTLDGIGIWRSPSWEPFIGARFSWLDSEDTIKHPSVGRLSLKEDQNLGMIMGTNIYLDKRENFAVNIEATLIDQASLRIGVKLWY